MKAMIFAAGLGSRLKPWTDRHPKALAIVNGKSLLQRNIEYLQQFGITDVIVNVHHFADQVIDTIQENKGWGSRITVSDESDQVLETGGGLKKARWYFDQGSFLVMNTDILTDLDLNTMIQFHRKHNPLATLAITLRESTRHFLFNGDDNLCGWRNTGTGEEKGPVLSYSELEKKQLRQRAFSGIQIIEPGIFSMMKLEGKFSIVDLYLELSRDNIIKGFEHNPSRLVDVGRPESLISAELLFH